MNTVKRMGWHCYVGSVALIAIGVILTIAVIIL